MPIKRLMVYLSEDEFNFLKNYKKTKHFKSWNELILALAGYIKEYKSFPVNKQPTREGDNDEV